MRTVFTFLAENYTRTTRFYRFLNRLFLSVEFYYPTFAIGHSCGFVLESPNREKILTLK